MKLIIASILALTATVATAETIPGGHALPCADVAAFTPVYADDGETVAYWNNPTCGTVDGWDMSDEQREKLYGPEEEPTDVASN